MSDEPQNGFMRITKNGTFISLGVALLLVGGVVFWSDRSNDRYAALSEKTSSEIGKLREEIAELRTSLAVQGEMQSKVAALAGRVEKIDAQEYRTRVKHLEEESREMAKRLREMEQAKREKQ